MKILIIGKNSYIGNHIDEWLSKRGHEVEQLDVLAVDWKSYDYSPFDAIVHVAGIVHRPDCKDWELYYDVNAVMPVFIAERFKASAMKGDSDERSVAHKSKMYVYFSTMGVYDAEKSLKGCIIDENTRTLKEGNSMYGKSKLMAEEGLLALQGVSFNIAIVRPPSVYGKGCRGGYITGFASIARLLPTIPQAYENAGQSFVYIDNLSECVRLIMENNLNGVFCPQDDEAPNANRLLEVICKAIGKRYRSSRFLGFCMRLVSFIPLVKKAYGGIEYARSLSEMKGFDYRVVTFEEGMKRTLA